MAETYIKPTGTFENAGIVMLSSKELLVRQMNLASQNLSNGDTVGFKSVMLTGLESIYRNPRLGAKSPAISYVKSSPVKRDISQGSLKQTSNPFDFAISGPGYFTLQVGDTTQYTRDGRFRINSQGKLTTMDGYLVQGSGGDIDLTPYTNFSVSKDGTLLGFDTQGVQTEVSKLKIVKFNDEQNDLSYVGMGRFLGVGETVPVERDTEVFNGVIEQSNVNPIGESIRLMRIMQVYGESQKITEIDDEMKARKLAAKAV